VTQAPLSASSSGKYGGMSKMSLVGVAAALAVLICLCVAFALYFFCMSEKAENGSSIEKWIRGEGGNITIHSGGDGGEPRQSRWSRFSDMLRGDTGYAAKDDLKEVINPLGRASGRASAPGDKDEMF
jgi:hypothetical protein